MKLDLACGQFVKPGFVGVDRSPDTKAEYLCDLTITPWVFGDMDEQETVASESVEEVHCSHFVEHVPDLVGFMNELHRVMVPEGLVTIVHPYQFSKRAWQDPTHVRALNEDSWLYYNREWREHFGLAHMGITANFGVESIDFALSPEWADRKDHPEIGSAIARFVNVVDDLHVVLRKFS